MSKFNSKGLEILIEIARKKPEKIVEFVLEDLETQIESNNADLDFLEALMFPRKAIFGDVLENIKSSVCGTLKIYSYNPEIKYSEEQYMELLINSTHALVTLVYNYFQAGEPEKYSKDELLTAINERRRNLIPSLLFSDPRRS